MKYGLICLLLISGLISGCDITRERFESSEETAIAEERSINTVVYEYDGDFLVRKIESSEMRRFYQADKVHAEQVRIQEFTPEPQNPLRYTLTSDRAEIDEKESRYIFKENVVVVSRDLTLYTNELIMDDLSAEIRAPGNVTIIRGDNILKGIGLVSDTDFDSIKLSRVTAEGKITDEDLIW